MNRATILASAMYRNGIRYIRRDPKTGRVILKTSDNLYVAIDNYWAIFHEVFCAKIYELEDKYTNKPFALFDLGMNRAYTSLYFSTFDNCKVIYGYEPHPETFAFARYNINLNKEYLNDKGIKVNIFEYGLGDKDATLQLLSISGRDGVSTVEGCQNSAVADNSKAQSINVKICSVSTEFEKRFAEINDQGLRKILKIDVEGAEYGIFEELCRTGQIKQFDLIIGDSHNGIEPIRTELEANGFTMEHIGGVGKCRDFLFIKA
jgi:FkbM family methyltransferase